MSTDPKIGDVNKPFYASKIGLDCTIPMVGNWTRSDFDWSSACDLGELPANVKPMDEQTLASDMAAFIKAAPRSWKEILQEYQGQPYARIYRALGSLRRQLGRAGDSPWFRYTFADHDFAFEAPPPRVSNFDSRHRPHGA